MTDGPRHRHTSPSRGERASTARRERVLAARAVRGAAVHRAGAHEPTDRVSHAREHEDDDFGLDDLRPPPLRRLARALGLAGGGVAVVGALGIGLFPTQTFLEQRSDTAEAQQRLDVLREQNEAFERRLERLQTDEEIERLAREQYNLAYPGEEAYAVLPAPLPPLELPELWPFGPMTGSIAPDAAAVEDPTTVVP
jgi:hypothetical protein